MLRDGANAIKVYVSGSFMQGSEIRPRLSEEKSKVIVVEVLKAGIRVTVHAYGEETRATAVNCSADSMHHGTGLKENPCEAMLKKKIHCDLHPLPLPGSARRHAVSGVKRQKGTLQSI